ncbi:MAG: thioredoxin family protein [Aquificaceae bacterium]
MRKWFFVLLILFLAGCSKQDKGKTAEVRSLIPKNSYAMLIVESESCIYCKQLKKDLQKQELSSQLQGIDVFSILYESNGRVRYLMKGKEHVSTEEELAKALGVRSFPQVFFYDREGNIILHLPGYQPPKTLTCSIKFVKEERFKRDNYMEYLRTQECI